MPEYQQLRGHRDLKVFQLAYKLAMDIYTASRSFPKDEKYSLTDQICRSSRSVSANIAEGFRKRQYPKMLPMVRLQRPKFGSILPVIAVTCLPSFMMSSSTDTRK